MGVGQVFALDSQRSPRPVGEVRLHGREYQVVDVVMLNDPPDSRRAIPRNLVRVGYDSRGAVRVVADHPRNEQNPDNRGLPGATGSDQQQFLRLTIDDRLKLAYPLPLMPGRREDRHQVNEGREVPAGEFYLGADFLFK